MGAPSGHPFFGNQFTDGGYITGSFKYTPTEKIGAEILNTVVSETSRHSVSKAVVPVDKTSSKWFNKNNIIIASVVTVVTIGSVLIYKHISKKKAMKESIRSISLDVGICVKCSEPLIESDYVPENKDENEAAHIVCKNCGEKNYAQYNAE